MFSRISFFSGSYYNSDSQKEGYPRYKSEDTAFLLALLPGFFIHGLGHIYAGDRLTGFALFGIEVVSALTVVGVGVHGAFGGKTIDSKFGLRNFIFFAGLVGFFGSWVYDFLHADTAVRKYNDNIRARIFYRSDQTGTMYFSLAISF